ncbi:MAG: OB-fold nucleic acid binding domain-containing protein [Bacteroidota bacterium]
MLCAPGTAQRKYFAPKWIRYSFQLFLHKQYNIPGSPDILSNPIEYLKGVGPQRAELLKKELNIFTFRDLLEHFPYRHVDKTKVNLISDINFQTEFIQVAGILLNVEVTGDKRTRRLTAQLKDKSGFLELTWFQGITWVQKMLQAGQPYLVYGKVGYFQGRPQIIHPEIEILTQEKQDGKNHLEPVYPTTEKLKARGFSGRQIGKLTETLIGMLREKDIPENLPAEIVRELKFTDRFTAFRQVHFPVTTDEYEQAVKRLKFEELFIAQLRMNLLRSNRHRFFQRGVV